ncbi:GGDEF domain-containing protein [Actinoplanes sp. NPDC024001]|uniref:GGDEF domain-containing protein n=1 Tax=Actinoplanes sp. NPDC024001 TaxID=3154598 RepID=UPI00340FE0F5
MGRPRAVVPAWAVHVFFLVCATVAPIGYELAGHAGQPAVQTLVAALPTVTFVVALRSGNLPLRRPWVMAVSGLALLVVAQLAWPSWVRDGRLGQAEGSLPDLMLSASHGLFLAGAALGLRRRMAEDAGGIVDAALVGLCAGGPLWVWGIQPHLTGASITGQTLLLIDVLVLCGVIGCLLRMATTAGPARAPLTYLLVTAAITLAALGVGSLSADGADRLAAQLWLLAFLTLAVVPLHPGVFAVTEPRPGAQPSGGRPHLAWLAAALSTNPLLTAVQTMRGSDSASLLLPIGTLMVIPLVLLRIHRLTVQREHAERTLAYQASHDELTGLCNRRHVMGEIDHALTGVHRGDLAGVTVLLCDLNGFKPINDRFGHLVGDEALTVVAQRLAAATAAGDLVARLGGDEFLVVRRAATAGDLADRIHDALNEPMLLSAGPVSVGVTIGAAHAGPGDATSREALIARADAAMYARKAARAA